MKYSILIPFAFIGLMIFFPVFAQENSNEIELEIDFFYSTTCPHCKAENDFLDKIEQEYSNIKINRYFSSDSKKILIDLLQKHNAERYTGLVPLTFVGDEFFPGFDSEDRVGEKIRDSIERQLLSAGKLEEKEEKEFSIPIIGKLDLSKYSLLAQAIILGFFDGFNICSLGALILILGLVLILRSRAKILIFGGTFIVVTVIVYGLLIFFWYQLFFYLAPVLKIMNAFIGVLGIGGGIYFFKQFLKYRKYGPTCDMNNGTGVVGKFSQKLQNSFKDSGGIWGILISILIFAAVITVVEFPCSAVIPVFFASALVNAQLPALTYIFYIIVFLFFYILDEIVVFLIAVFTMNIKIASSKVMIWITLIESIVLFGLGIYYLIGF
jgi:thiol-disulfide isomerase/thioredoxin